jgi:starch synthase
MSRLKILFVVSECAPIVKTGGLGDVAGALPAELRRRGHDVRVVMPRYRAAKAFPAEKLPAPLEVPTGVTALGAAVWRAEIAGGVPVYLVEHDGLFDRGGIYGDGRGEYPDNLRRYAFLSQAALRLCSYLDFEPDVLHAHDWQSAFVPVYVEVLGPSLGFATVPATVLTIHNLGYQGRFPLGQYAGLGLAPEHLNPGFLEFYGTINVLKGGLLAATQLSTVSPCYAQEIQTPAGGAGLDGVLRLRSRALIGILNGIDQVRWDPATDPHLPAHYDADDLRGKAECKAALQAELGLPVRPEVPLCGLVSRFVAQKGIDIFADTLGDLLDLDLQFAVLGAGDGGVESYFTRLTMDTPNFKARFGHHERLAHRIEAGADLFVMPSRYEPCGLSQMHSQRYGTLPLVRAVGGLKDTVEHDVTGFMLTDLSAAALGRGIAGAAEAYRERPEQWRAMQRAAMGKQMGWDRAAAQYEGLYRLAVARKAGRL